ncbi:MAG: hypothetical protein AMJ38_00430 [Dehalococcoidia bacterium DG_22]|nr:MAG: hypothetical protein AMJ38_00430 [Dehalococcoidia bacterium DG_22]
MGKGRCWLINTRVLVALLAALAAVLVIACACGEGEEEPSPSPTAVATPTPSPTPGFPFEGPVGIDLSTFGAFFEEGKPVQLGITVAVRDPMTLYYRTSQRYDLAVVNSEGQEVWRWSRDRAFAQVTEEVSLGTNEMLTFPETWDQRDNDGQQVPVENYQIVAESSHCDANYENCGQLTTSATILIRPSQGEP